MHRQDVICVSRSTLNLYIAVPARQVSVLVQASCDLVCENGVS